MHEPRAACAKKLHRPFDRASAVFVVAILSHFFETFFLKQESDSPTVRSHRRNVKNKTETIITQQQATKHIYIMTMMGIINHRCLVFYLSLFCLACQNRLPAQAAVVRNKHIRRANGERYYKNNRKRG